MPAWPSSLPDFDADGYEEGGPDNVVRTQMDAGPAKQRRRYGNAARSLQATILLDPDEFDTFFAFHHVDLADGATSFTRALPRTGATVTMRFTGPWSARAVEKGLYYALSLDLEILP